MASPGGCVAAIGSTGRIPNGLQSSRSNSAGTGGDRSSRGQTNGGDGVGELGRGVGRLGAGLQLSLELEHAVAVDLTAESGWEQALCLGPVMCELSGRRRAHPDPAAELDLRHDGDPDERRDRGVGARGTEQRVLQLGVGALERAIVPVEASTRFGGGDQQRDKNGRKSACSSDGFGPGVGAGEDRGRRLAQELVERDPGVLPAGQCAGARLDEGPHKRPVLVERRAAALDVLLEGERQVVAFLERTAEEDEGAETKGAQGEMQLRCAYRHPSAYSPAARLLPDTPDTSRPSGSVALPTRANDRPAAKTRPPSAPVDLTSADGPS